MTIPDGSEQDTVRHTVRFPAELYAVIKLLAEQQMRSINSQINIMLMEHPEAQKLLKDK